MNDHVVYKAAIAALISEMNTIAVLAEHAGTWDKVLAATSLEDGEERRKRILRRISSRS